MRAPLLPRTRPQASPSWSSTIDQHLEIDTEGVIFVHEDARLPSYPHPAPGVPVLPHHGPRWPLERTVNGTDGAGYTIHDPDTGRTWHFADPGMNLAVLEQIDDRNGNWINFAYDRDSGAPIALAHSGGYRLRLASADGRVTALYLAGAAPYGDEQKLVSYGYDGAGNLTEVTNSCGRPLRFAYDEAGRVTSWTDTNDRSYDYEYDDQDRCIAEGSAAGHMSLRLAYSSVNPGSGLRVTTTTTGAGHTRRYLINTACQVVAETDPLGAITRYCRDRNHRLVSRTDALGHTTAFRYDDAGNLTAVVRPDGREARRVRPPRHGRG